MDYSLLNKLGIHEFLMVWMNELHWKFEGVWDTHMISKYLPQKYLFKGKKSHLPGRHPLSQAKRD